MTNESKIVAFNSIKADLIKLKESFGSNVKIINLIVLDSVKNASPEVLDLFYPMVVETKIENMSEFDTGQNNLDLQNYDQALENTSGEEMGKARTLATIHGQSDDKAA